MIVAIALLGLAVSGLISMISSSLAGAAMTREYERAAMLANNPAVIPRQWVLQEARRRLGTHQRASPLARHHRTRPA